MQSRNPRALEPSLAMLFFPFEPDEEEHRRLLRAAKVMLAYYPDLVRRLLPGLVSNGLRTHDLVAQPALYARIQDSIPDEIALQTVLVGPVDRCVARLREYVAAGCRHFVFEPFWGMTSDRLAASIQAAAVIRNEFRLTLPPRETPR